MLDAGDKAPAFDLPTDGGGRLSAAELAGRPYVLYFYPRDNTPGCTTEACDFRDGFGRVQAAGATVVGVSKDSVKSHDKFKDKFALPFPLVSDEALELHKAYGAWGKKMMYGRETEGTIRSTFLIGEDGVIVRAWPKVSVKGHVAEVLEALAALG